MKNAELHRLLRSRGMTVKKLSGAIGSRHSHVSQVLNNVPNRGGNTRRKLAKLLQPAELESLGWDGNGNLRESGGMANALNATRYQGASDKQNSTVLTNRFLVVGSNPTSPTNRVPRGTKSHVEQITEAKV